MTRELVRRATEGDHDAFSSLVDASVDRHTVIDSMDAGIWVYGGTPLVKSNRISGAKRGIFIDSDDAAPTVEANLVEGSSEAGSSVSGATPTLQANTLRDNVIAISWLGPRGLVEGNEITRGGDGIQIRSGQTTFAVNSVRGAHDIGIWIYDRSRPTLSANVSGDNGENLRVGERAIPVIDDSNEICEGVMPESPRTVLLRARVGRQAGPGLTRATKKS